MFKCLVEATSNFRNKSHVYVTLKQPSNFIVRNVKLDSLYREPKLTEFLIDLILSHLF
jgi:hypothetical protein